MPLINLGEADLFITCRTCGSEEKWSTGEQKFMLKLQEDGKIGDVKKPSQCKKCRAERKAKRNAVAT